MEVSPFLFKWLVELNIIEQNEKDNFISDDIIYLLCGGKYFDRILYSFQNADLNTISNGDKYFLIEILHKINTYYNKFLTNKNIEND